MAVVQTNLADSLVAATGVLDTVAARCRSSGLFLVALAPDGALAYADGAADAFFQRLVLPLLQQPRIVAALLNPSNDSRPQQLLPGVIFTAIPHVEKRQLQGFLVVAAIDGNFAETEEFHRACGRLQLDAAWLFRLAAGLATHDEVSLVRSARLLTDLLRDQHRVQTLEATLSSMSEQLSSTYEELSLIYQVSGGMKVNRAPADFFKETCLEVQQVIGVRTIGVALHTAQRRLEPTFFGPLDLPPAGIARLSDELIRAVRERHGAVLSNDLSTDKKFAWLAPHARQLLAVPLQRHDQILGCLYALDKENGVFDSTDTKLLNSIAIESAIYLENAKLFDDMRGLMMGLMHSLTSAVDAKDAYTCGHSERVALLSRHLAQQAGLNDADVEQVYMAGLLHDVGKIGVPESVLQKTGKLTPEEFEQMKKHPEIGARILQDVRQIQQLIPGVLHHHERYDGRGYPAGLAGENIPLMGRIICLADCFDAMTSNRTYRRALPIEVAMAEIRRCAGTQFDPALAEAFLRTSAERYRELLSDHRQKSKRLLDQHEALAAA